MMVGSIEAVDLVVSDSVSVVCSVGTDAVSDWSACSGPHEESRPMLRNEKKREMARCPPLSDRIIYRINPNDR